MNCGVDAVSGEPAPPSVTVKLKRGTWEIEITCAPDKVQQAVESVLAGMVSKEQVSIEASLDSPAPGEDGEEVRHLQGAPREDVEGGLVRLGEDALGRSTRSWREGGTTTTARRSRTLSSTSSERGPYSGTGR